MINAALELASNGWPVFPCHETGDKAKSPYTHNGFLDASTDPALIKKWWDYKPQALIGVPIPLRCIVIDIDPRHGGTRKALEARTGTLPKTLTTWSGRNDGGQHLRFYRPEGDYTGRKLKSMGIDIRDGGRHYCIVPPSPHPDTGQPYRWENFDTGPIAWLPWRLEELLKPDPVQFTRLANLEENGDYSGLLASVAAQEEGGRNDYLFWAACRMAEKQALDDHVHALVDAAMDTGLTEQEITTTIASARRRIG